MLCKVITDGPFSVGSPKLVQRQQREKSISFPLVSRPAIRFEISYEKTVRTPNYYLIHVDYPGGGKTITVQYCNELLNRLDTVNGLDF